jgi:hypothetical protein
MDSCYTQFVRVSGAATMETYRSLGKVGDGGILHLDIPVGAPNSEFEVVVVYSKAGATQPEAPQNHGWPSGYFEQTAGSIQDPTFRRHEQGKFEKLSHAEKPQTIPGRGRGKLVILAEDDEHLEDFRYDMP